MENNRHKNKRQSRNTSYYKSKVGKKQKKESSPFLEIAKKRQWNNYRRAMLALILLMTAFAGLIFLGVFLRSLVDGQTDGGGDSGNFNGDGNNTEIDAFIPAESSSEPGINFERPDDINNNTAQPPEVFNISESFFNYNGVYLDIELLESLEDLRDFIDNIKSKGVNAVNIDVKKDDGSLPFLVNGQTDAVMGTAGENNYIDLQIRDIIDLLHANEIYVSGTIACFKDNFASSVFVNYALRSSAAAATRWHDSDGNYWLNAYSEGARDYISGIVEDSAKLGFDEIILSWFFFPNISNPASVIYDPDGSGMTRYEVIKDFVSSQRQTLDNIAPQAKLGLKIPTLNFLNMPSEVMGLDPGALADWCNFFSASFAPANIPSGTHINGNAVSNPESDPHGTVRALCGHFKYLSDRIYFRPELQAWGSYGDEQILRQQQALYENGINMWQLINYGNNY
ncbi:MAG: putative glycoside hydrolase [Oscillospiraceae bacterium]|nr:putative glycoside hydrolase [Oscillospiraceae bacterium]